MSDHNNSPRGVAEPAIDIGDNYVFPSPSRPGRLVLAMTVFPNAQPGALFSDAADYRFRLRPVTIPVSGSRFEVGTDEYDVTVTFAAPVTLDDAGDLVQEGTVTLPTGAAVPFRVNDEQGTEVGGARVFAGLRMDPLFNDSTAYVETLATRQARLPGERRQRRRRMGHPGHRRRARRRHDARASAGNAVRRRPRRRSRPAGSRCAWTGSGVPS